MGVFTWGEISQGMRNKMGETMIRVDDSDKN